MTKNADFLHKNTDISKIKKDMELKGTFSENTYVCVLTTKFQVSSIIITGFRQEVILPPPPTPAQNEQLKSPPRLGLISE